MLILFAIFICFVLLIRLIITGKPANFYGRLFITLGGVAFIGIALLVFGVLSIKDNTTVDNKDNHVEIPNCELPLIYEITKGCVNPNDW